MNSLKSRIEQLESLLYYENDSGVIRKVGNKWRILKKNRRDYWDAEYDTKADAKAALKAYWANKSECVYSTNNKLTLEDFSSEIGRSLIRNIQHFLIKVFGHTLYFDHYTNKSVELYYKGDLIAELLYKDKTGEIVIIPNNITKAPVSFYDTSEYEIQDYLSDLIIGDV